MLIADAVFLARRAEDVERDAAAAMQREEIGALARASILSAALAIEAVANC